MNIQDAIERVKQKEPLFTSLIMQLEPIESKDVPTLGTDGERLMYNQKFLDTLTPGEGSAVVLHEVLHAAFGHLWRRKKREQFRWNASADYAINTIVNETFPLPKGSLLDMKYYGLSAETIYDMLPKTKTIQIWCDKKHWRGDGKKGQKKGLVGKIRGALGKGEKTDAEQAAIEARWKRLFDKNILKQYGKMPESIRRVVEKEYYVPVIDWTSLVQNLLSEDNNDYSFSVPDRRFLEDEFMLPDMASVDKLRDIVFAYDTSGSIEDNQLTAFYLETLNLFSNFSSLTGWIAVCDADLHSFEEIQPQMTFPDFKFVGGGGTAFEPVFDKIKKLGIKPKAVFYFTDCEGSFPSEDPGYPVYWLKRSYVEVGDYSPSVPFGKVIPFLAK